MKQLYLLYHVYEYGKELEHECTKELGIYSSLEKAEEAKERYSKLEGFNKYPIESFFVVDFTLDKDEAWTEGFVSSDEINEDFRVLTSHFNEWLGIKKSIEESWEDGDYHDALVEISVKAYNSNDATKFAEYISGWITFSKTPSECLGIATKILDSLNQAS
jgi:ribonucleotide reductase alpha subunit